MTAEEALLQLGESTADAVAGSLLALAPGGIERGSVSVVGVDGDPLEGIQTPAVAASVSYVDGVTGGNIFVLTVAAGRRLAAAMMGMDPPETDEPLSELELSAVSEAMNQMMAAAAVATSKVLGEEVEISVPDTQLLAGPGGTGAVYAKTPHATVVGFSIFGESSRLVQLVPNAFVVRMSRALGEREGELLAAPGAGGGPGAFGVDVLRDVKLRVWAELGRAQLPVGHAVALGRGSVVELDRAVDAPVDLFANGHRIGTGRLLLVEPGQWAVQLEEIFSTHPEITASPEGVN